jgi:hypothetical protein
MLLLKLFNPALHKLSENDANSLNVPANLREYSLIFFIIRANSRPLAGKV